MQSLHRVEKSPPLIVRAALRQEIFRLRVSSERLHLPPPYRHIPPLEMTMLAGTIGNTFGARVQRVQRGRLTALRAEGCGRLSAAGYASLHHYAQGATAALPLRMVVAPCGRCL